MDGNNLHFSFSFHLSFSFEQIMLRNCISKTKAWINGRSLRYPLLRVSSRPQETIVSVIVPENCGESFVFILLLSQ